MDNLPGNKAVFTTGDVAKLFDVNINTVVKWIETGQLKGFKLPSSGARRVTRDEIIKFMSRYDVQAHSLRKESVQILLVSGNLSTVNQFKQSVNDAFGYDLRIAANGIEAGMAFSQAVPDIVFVDIQNVPFNLDGFARALLANQALSHVKLVALVPADADSASLTRRGFWQVMVWPSRRGLILDLADKAAAGSLSVQAPVKSKR